MKRLLACDAIWDAMKKKGLDDESQEFEDVLWICAEMAVEGADYSNDVLQHLGEERYGGNWVQGYMTLRFWADSHGITAVTELLEDLFWEGRKAIENGIPAGKAAGNCPGAADAAEQACYEDLPCDGATGGGCAELETGAAEEKLLDYRTEDEEAAADWLAGAASVGLAQTFGEEMGISGPEPGEPSDKTGRMEGRKARWTGLPPMSEYRTSLYAQSVLR